MKKKLITFLVTVSMAMALFTGCGNVEETSKSSENVESSNPAISTETSTENSEEIPNFNAEGYPIVDEQVTISILMLMGDELTVTAADEMPAIQRLEEQTGIDLEIEFIKQSDWKTKFNLMLASGEYPDIIMAQGTGWVDYEEYGVTQKVLLPLDDLIDKYIPNYAERIEREDFDPTIGLVASDGQTYTVGYTIGNTYALNNNPTFINQDWLDALNLETPKNVEELTDVLRAFKTQDPNGNGKQDEVPFVIRLASRNWEMVQLFGVPATNGWMYIDDEGQVKLAGVQDGYRECMEWMHTLYEEGLLDPETFSMDSSTFKAKLNSENAGFFFAYRLNGNGYDEIADSCSLWIPDESASFVAGYGKANPHTYITNQCETPEVAARLINAFLEKETMFSLYLGEKDATEGAGWKYLENGKIQSYEIDIADSRFNGVNRTANFGPIFMPVKTNEEWWTKGAQVQERMDFCNALKDAGAVQKYSNMMLELVVLTNEEAEKMTFARTEAHSTMSEYVATFIKDGVTDENWATYVKTLEDIGAFECLEFYQKGVDELLKSMDS